MKNIVKTFPGVKALDGASLRVEKGQIHALIGENGAGKSTLMKILLGVYSRDNGEIIYKEAPINFKTPNEALSSGVSMIHQETSLIPTMDVTENIWIGRENKFGKLGFVSKKKRRQAADELLRRLKINISPDTPAHRLSVAAAQLVELARAVSYDSEIVIMDEPTSSLTDSEVSLLYDVIRGLSSNGTAIIFISHKLEEIFEICSRVTVMRDGKFVAEHDTAHLDKNQLITEIAGRKISELFPKEAAEIGEVAMDVRNLTSVGVFKNVSFQVRKGEILGFCGLVGAGRTEIMRAIFGIDKPDSGEIFINGGKARINTPEEAIKNGLAMVTEDRLRMGIISNLSVLANISLAYLRSLSCLGFVNGARERAECTAMVNKLSVKTPNLKQRIGALSGGNQQKAIIARWLETDPEILIMDEPTRGIDVGSKSEIHRLISSLAQQGKAIILVSSELPEILGMSDRITVVREGRLVADMPRAEATQEILLRHAFGTALEERHEEREEA
jgi:ABC-type sugar transport system ATPase subunit